jgi:hypothetical protein
MNQPPLLPQPPFGDDTDDALNALLDGELDAFAREHDMAEDVARARLEAWPEYPARIAALEAVRNAVQESPPALDDLTRRRLVRTAVNALPAPPAHAGRSRSSARWIAAAAAAVLVIVGIGAAIASMGDGGDSSQRASSSAGAPLHGNVGDLGDVTSPTALRALLDRRHPSSTTAPAAPGVSGSTTASSAGTSEAQQLNREAAGAPAATSTTPTTLGPDACAQQLAGARKTAFVGTGTFKTAPVTIVGITKGGRTIVFVVSSTDCTNVLASISR